MKVSKVKMSETKNETKSMEQECRVYNYETNDLETEDLWTIIESYFRDQHLKRCVRHQLESYNNFTSNQIQETIDMFNPVVIKSENDFDKKSGKYSLEINITLKELYDKFPIEFYYMQLILMKIMINNLLVYHIKPILIC